MLWLYAAIFLASCTALVLLLLRLSRPKDKVTILCLGDLGRSPRMQYHAMSLSDNGFHVQLIGYGDSKCHDRLINDNKIQQHLLKPFPRLPRFLFPIYAPVKAVLQSAQLLTILLFNAYDSKFLMLQNPPAIPTLLVAQLVCTLVPTCKLVIDWHNFGYTQLALSLGRSHWIVKIAHWYEKRFGKGAYANFCVTRAMQQELSENWGVTASVLYDHAPDFFRPLPVAERHALFQRLQAQGAFDGRDAAEDSVARVGVSQTQQERERACMQQTPFTELDAFDVPRLREQRPALVVSSTSWTEDEDFDLLLEAARVCDQHAALSQAAAVAAATVENGVPEAASRVTRQHPFPRILFVITGKGPMKAQFEEKVRTTCLQHVRIVTAWLAAEDYPKLLGSADLGVCLHTSSSGLDLPMKVVDMFGCQLPVCAVDFKCLSELVVHDSTGLVFNSGAQLAHHLIDLFRAFPHACPKLDQYRRNLAAKHSVRWAESWNTTALPVFRGTA